MPTAPAVLDGPSLWSAQAHLPSVLGRQLVVERGQGCHLHTTDGRRPHDGTADLWHADVGHAHPALAEAARRQVLRLQVSPPSTTTDQELADPVQAVDHVLAAQEAS